jgi:type I restriction-modification system DNA methylase subunit
MVSVNLDSAANELGVSTATVRNWAKQGILEQGEQGLFALDVIQEVKSKIKKGEIDRLKKRANKTQSNAFFIPTEYAENRSLVQEIEKILYFIEVKEVEKEAALFSILLKQLFLRGEVEITTGDSFPYLNSSKWRRECVRREVKDWYEKKLSDHNASDLISVFEASPKFEAEDALGIIFQSLQREGDKSSKGSYYTPTQIIDDALDQISLSEGRIIDPCCGTGKILLRAIAKGIRDPKLIYGIEIDELAWRISRFNTLLAIPEQEFEPQIYRGDALFELATGSMFSEGNDLLDYFDFVVTNPPWGALSDRSKESLVREYFPRISSGETFSLFTDKCLRLCKQRGVCALFLPESILNIRTHKDVREVLLSNSEIISISQLGRPFQGVFTPVVRITFKKAPPENDSISIISEGGQISSLHRNRVFTNPDKVFEVSAVGETEKLLDYIYSKPHTTLAGQADWALGIVTGNNAKHLLATPDKDEAEPVYRGADIESYRKLKPSSFIIFSPDEFQQVAPEWKYRAKEKLIYKFISSKLVFAYDDQGVLTLNSANILIPKAESVSVKPLLAYLNSSVAQFVFTQKFRTHKVLRGDLEKLPIPLFSKSELEQLSNLADRAISGENLNMEVDELIFSALNFSGEQIALMKS